MREGLHANTNDLWYGSTKRVTWRTNEKAPGVGLGLFMYGALGGIRTHDPCLRRAVLYPAELRVQRARMIPISFVCVHRLDL